MVLAGLAGCVEPSPAEAPPAPQEANSLNVVSSSTISWHDGYAVVEEWESNMTLLAIAWSSEIHGSIGSGDRLADVVLVDANGKLHRFRDPVSNLQGGEARELTLERPDGPTPMIVYGSCGCRSLLLVNYDEDNVMYSGQRDLVTNRTVEAWAGYYPHSQIPDDTTPTQNNVTLRLPETMKTYSYDWGVNLEGSAELVSPSGQVIASWETSGNDREVDLRGWQHPLEPGPWDIRVEGIGHVEIFFEVFEVTPEIFEQYGVRYPF